MFSACRELLPKAEECIPQMSSKLVFTHKYISFQAHASDALSSPLVNHKDERQVICEKTMNQTNTIKHIVPRSVCGFGWVKATLVYRTQISSFPSMPSGGYHGDFFPGWWAVALQHLGETFRSVGLNQIHTSFNGYGLWRNRNAKHVTVPL